MLARIFQPAPNAMQSGRAKSAHWVLEFDGEVARRLDPLTGWSGSADTSTQVRMTFETRDEAIAFCQRQGLAFQVTEPQAERVIVKSYADNFSAYRKRPWTH